MIKGSRKQMIVVRTGNSRYFDEAYFVLKNGVENQAPSGKDILREANRILEEIMPTASKPVRWRAPAWLLFAGGSLCGGLVSALFALLL